MSRNSSPSGSPGGLRGLRVSRTAEEGQVPIDESQVDQVTNIIHRALRLLESSQGREVLRHIGRDVILKSTDIEPLYPRSDRNFGLMDKYVNQFLRLMRADFPEVVLEVMLGVEAEFVRWEWKKGPETRLEDFVTRDSGCLVLDLDIMTHLFTTSDMDEQMTTIFFMILFVSHEIVHCFVGFITGHGLVETPESVGGGGHPGESGYRWEADFFGGLVTMYGLPERGIQQAGIPYFFLEHTKDARGRRVSQRYIDQFVTGDGTIRLPLEFSETETREVTMEGLVNGGYLSMPTIRKMSEPPGGSSRASSRRSSRSSSNSRPHSQAPTYQTASSRRLPGLAGPHKPAAGAIRTAPPVRSDPRTPVSDNNNNTRQPPAPNRKNSGPPQRPGAPALTKLAIPSHEQRPVANSGHNTASPRAGPTPTTQRRQSPASANTGLAVTPVTQRRQSPATTSIGSAVTPTTQRRQSPASAVTPTQRLVMRPATHRPASEGAARSDGKPRQPAPTPRK